MSKNQQITFLKSLFQGKTNSFFLQLFRYTFVGGLAFAVDFGALFLLTEHFKLHYLISAGISFILGLIVNYFLSVKWVFNSRTVKNHFLEFVIFSLIGLIGLGLNEFFLWIFTEKFLMYYLVSKIVTAIIVYLWNFMARKVILFDKKSPNNE